MNFSLFEMVWPFTGLPVQRFLVITNSYYQLSFVPTLFVITVFYSIQCFYLKHKTILNTVIKLQK